MSSRHLLDEMRKEKEEITFIVFLAIILGATLRLYPVLQADFPLNDGGLFYKMIEDLLTANFRMPTFTSYNNANIPFAYPPFTLYLGAFLKKAGISVYATLQYLPAIMSILTIPAFYFLAKTILKKDNQAAFATIAFALNGDTFLWRVMGGGITRSFGLFFAVIDLYFIVQLLESPTKKSFWGYTVLFSALTLMSHPEAAFHTITSAFVLFIFRGLSWKNCIHLFAAFLASIALSSVWWGSVINAHGFAPFFAVLTAREWEPWYRMFLVYIFSGVYINSISVIGLTRLQKKQVVFFVFWITIMFVTLSRSAGQFAIIPTALIFGVGLDTLQTHTNTLSTQRKSYQYINQPIFILIIIFVFTRSYILILTSPGLKPISQEQREAIAWLEKNTGNQSPFLIIDTPEFIFAHMSEWMPALSNKTSVSTVQGYEWVSGIDFSGRIKAYEALQKCRWQDETCLTTWAQGQGISFRYVLIVNQKNTTFTETTETMTTSPLQNQLLASQNYQMIFNNHAVCIFEKSN